VTYHLESSSACTMDGSMDAFARDRAIDTAAPRREESNPRVLNSVIRTIPLAKFFVSSDDSDDEDDDFIIASPNGELDYLISDFNDVPPSAWVRAWLRSLVAFLCALCHLSPVAYPCVLSKEVLEL